MKFALLFLLSAGSALPHQFVIVSDIHFNPLANPSLLPQLTAADPAQWEGILTNDSPQHVPKYGEDTSWPLLSALVTGLQNVTPKPGLIIVSGDILPHRFQSSFSDPVVFRAFAKKTFEFVALELKKAAGDTPIVYALGNNDQECGDYQLQPDGPFLHDIEPTVRALSRLDATSMSSWFDTGSYVTVNPLTAHHRIISLNTTFWSSRYKNTCGTQVDPGQTVVSWLSGELAKAKDQKSKVWLILHIPPGIDGHSSARAGKTVTFWQPKYEQAFENLLNQYGNTVELGFAGHMHLDDIRFVNTHLVLVNPAVSPNIGQNPAFRVMTVDSHARPKDLITYYMSDLQKLTWQTEYDTRQAYGFKKIDERDYQALFENPSMTGKWNLYYSVSRPTGLSQDKTYLRSLSCASAHIDVAGYEACMKNQNP